MESAVDLPIDSDAAITSGVDSALIVDSAPCVAKSGGLLAESGMASESVPFPTNSDSDSEASSTHLFQFTLLSSESEMVGS